MERELLLTARLGADTDADRETPQINVVDVDDASHITLRRGRQKARSQTWLTPKTDPHIKGVRSHTRPARDSDLTPNLAVVPAISSPIPRELDSTKQVAPLPSKASGHLARETSGNGVRAT